MLSLPRTFLVYRDHPPCPQHTGRVGLCFKIGLLHVLYLQSSERESCLLRITQQSEFEPRSVVFPCWASRTSMCIPALLGKAPHSFPTATEGVRDTHLPQPCPSRVSQPRAVSGCPTTHSDTSSPQTLQTSSASLTERES